MCLLYYEKYRWMVGWIEKNRWIVGWMEEYKIIYIFLIDGWQEGRIKI